MLWGGTRQFSEHRDERRPKTSVCNLTYEFRVSSSASLPRISCGRKYENVWRGNDDVSDEDLLGLSRCCELLPRENDFGWRSWFLLWQIGYIFGLKRWKMKIWTITLNVAFHRCCSFRTSRRNSFLEQARFWIVDNWQFLSMTFILIKRRSIKFYSF